jgi:hypothetical protein
MVLDNEQITKFQTLYKKHFGKEISKEEIYKKRTKTTALFRIMKAQKLYNFKIKTSTLPQEEKRQILWQIFDVLLSTKKEKNKKSKNKSTKY